ncbi:unnamed protein product, partial [Rotaria sordida]
MKVILIVLIIAQLHGAFSTSVSLEEPRGLIQVWDFFSPFVMPIAEKFDSTIGTLLNIHSTVTTTVSNAIGDVTSWIGDLIPALGKRDLENDARVNLLTELKSFNLVFQQSILETLQSFL